MTRKQHISGIPAAMVNRFFPGRTANRFIQFFLSQLTKLKPFVTALCTHTCHETTENQIMIRLLVAACIVYILLPTNLEPRQLAGSGEPVTTIDALTALDAIARDLASICERNTTACETGKSILNRTKEVVLSAIGTGASGETSLDPADTVDETATGSTTE